MPNATYLNHGTYAETIEMRGAVVKLLRGSRFASMDLRHLGAVGERLAAQMDHRREHQQPDPHSNALLGAEMKQREVS